MAGGPAGAKGGNSLSGYGILFRGVHQVVQGTALGVAVTFGIGDTAAAHARQPDIPKPKLSAALHRSTAVERILSLDRGGPPAPMAPQTAIMPRAATPPDFVSAVPKPPAVAVQAQREPPFLLAWDAPVAATADRSVGVVPPPVFDPGDASAPGVASKFPAFTADVAAEPWLGDAGARRSAQIVHAATPLKRRDDPLPAAATAMPVAAEAAHAPIAAFDLPVPGIAAAEGVRAVPSRRRTKAAGFAIAGAKRPGRKPSAGKIKFPAFDPDVSTAPWLGDVGARRAALVARSGDGSSLSAIANGCRFSRPDDRPLPGSAADEASADGDDGPTIAPADAAPTEDADGADGQASEADVLPVATLSRGGIAFSGGYSSIEGPVASIKIARTNIGAPGRDITASARYSKVQSLLELGVADADFMGSKMSIAPTFFYSRSSATGFDKDIRSSLFRQTARGVNVYLGRPLAHGFRVAANYRFSDEDFLIRQRNALCDVGLHGVSFCNAIGRSTSSVLSVALSLDRRDSAIDPARGFQLRVTQDIAGPGGTTRYLRMRAGGTFYHRLGGNIGVSIGLEGGVMRSFDDRSVPLFDRFYIGGNSMRGFDLRGMGPKVIPVAAAVGQTTAVGGKAYYVGRLEMSFRLDGTVRGIGATPSVFVDAGSVFGVAKADVGPGERLIGNSAEPRVAVGIGVSFNAGPGKLRFNLAHPVVRQEGDRAKPFSISFGTAF